MRKTYEKPGMTRVDLVPSEAVLSACRDYATEIAGPGGSLPDPCYFDWALSCKVGGS